MAQQSEPYKNIGKMHVLYSFNFVEVAGCDLWGSGKIFTFINVPYRMFIWTT